MSAISDPDVTRDKDATLRVHLRQPFNAGPPPALLRTYDRTPNRLFYVRNHGNIPRVDPDSYRLRVEGLVEQEMSLDLAELADLPRAEVLASVQCAGNRRDELNSVRPTSGSVPWGGEAIGTALWEGIPLSTLLARVEPSANARHVEFEGLDTCEHDGERFPFGASIPLDKALASDVLLADTMNGAPLPRLHGAPLRLIVPGYIGARSVKWLARIRLRETPSDNHYQAIDYRIPSPTSENGPALTDQPVNSLICTPDDGGTVDAGDVAVSGWAFAGDRSVVRVDVTTDGGHTWTEAELAPELGKWAWRFWEAVVPLAPGQHEIAVRAVDDAANSQPERLDTVWNPPGYVNNAWSRTVVEAV